MRLRNGLRLTVDAYGVHMLLIVEAAQGFHEPIKLVVHALKIMENYVETKQLFYNQTTLTRHSTIE